MRPTYNQLSLKSANHGFTLVELVIVITIVGILAAGATQFIRNPTQAFFDSETRANLTDRADTALRRMAREIGNALPNSVRTAVNGGDHFIEFVPVSTAGRYRTAVGVSATDDPLDFSLATDTFDILGPSVNISAGDRLVIYNLGVAGANVYDGTAATNNVRPLATTGTLSVLSFTGGTFPLASPSSRFHVVSTPVTFACDMTNGLLLRYSGYAIQATQPNSIAILNGLATPSRLASGLTSCNINYLSGVLQRNGLVTTYLSLAQNSAKVSLMHQVTVVNSP